MHIVEWKLTGSEIMFVIAELEDDDSKKDDGISFSSLSGPAWAGSERDYTYDEVNTFHTF